MLQVTHFDAPNNAHITQPTPRAKSVRLVSQKSISVSFSSVEVDGATLDSDPKDVSVSRMAEALRLAQLHGKEEMMIHNIAPGVSTSDADASLVPLLKKKIQDQIEIASRDILIGAPECRLDLKNGQYGMRCYLGRTKPTDFIFASDRLSDSR